MTFHSLPHRAGTTSLPFSSRSDRPTHIPANTGRPHHRQAGPPPGHHEPWLTFRSMHRSPLSPTSRAGTSPARPRRQANPYRGTTHLAYATHPTRLHRSDIPAPSISERHTAPGAAPPTPIRPTFLTGSQTGPARRPSAAPSPSSVTYLTVPFPSQALRRPSPPRSRAVPPLADRSPLPRTTPI